MTEASGRTGGLLTKAARLLGRAVREPLVQFLAAGLVIFGVNDLIHGPDRGPPGESITVSQGQVQQIAQSYRLLAGRLPSKAELDALVDDFVTEEVDYREAVAMGLDANDTIVRRRMRQKLEFLLEDADASSEPTEADLKAWLDAHASQYRLPERRAFRQILASGDKRGEAAPSAAADMLKQLRAGADPSRLGDPSMLPAAMPLTTEQGVEALFGDAFAHDLFAHEGDGWFGPVASPFGDHLVMQTSREPGRSASVADVHDRLRNDWIEDRRNQRRIAFQSKLRKRYQVRIDWPEPYASQSAAPDATPAGTTLGTAAGPVESVAPLSPGGGLPEE
ncbi:MAG: peptidyl-prolyl cis-trans isomerase [Alphaproteobacteria bacterium]|nr:peptidyl-prolyl cis-trans isomerase [Alphaproteobacteria bacterium]